MKRKLLVWSLTQLYDRLVENVENIEDRLDDNYNKPINSMFGNEIAFYPILVDINRTIESLDDLINLLKE